jgi:hypothetical protein
LTCSHQYSSLSTFLLPFFLRLFSLNFSFFDIFPGVEHEVSASSIAEPSESLIFSSFLSSSLGVSARFVPTVLPLWANGWEEGGAEGGYPVEGPEWEGRGGEEEGDTVTTAVDEDTNTDVDTAEEEWEEGGLMGVRAGLKDSLGGVVGEVDGVEGGGEGVRVGAGREGEVAISTSSGREEGWMEDVVDCWSLMEEGGTAEPWRGVMGERVRMVNEGRDGDRTVARGGVGGVGGRRTRRGVSEGSTSMSTVIRSLLTPHSSYETAKWREEMNEWRGTASARWREERNEFMLEGGGGKRGGVGY